MAYIARAVDLGFGYVKLSKDHLSASWGLACDAFPALAPQRYGHTDVGGGALSRLAVVPVEIDGHIYQVGPDSLLAASGAFSRMLDDSFFTSPQYLALYRGALHYMGLLPGQQIDAMVVGLPIKQYRDAALVAHLQRQFAGDHPLPARAGHVATPHTFIHSVHVMPQTVGALVAQSHDAGAGDRVQNETNLTIDVGYGTLQWMLSRGMTPIPARCDCTMGGVSALLQTMLNEIDPTLTGDPNMLARFDNGLLDPAYAVKVRGKQVDLAPFRSRLRAMLGEHVATMMRSLGRTNDIDNIYLCGGGAQHYLPVLKAAFPDYAINVDDPTVARFANLRGYQLIAEARARNGVVARLATA